MGVWGSLPDWGPQHRYQVYLPTGSIVRQRGRGQRKEQASFLARARKLASSKTGVTNTRAFRFVAQVKNVEAISATGVEADGDRFYMSVARTGITDKEESDTLAASARLVQYALHVVDPAATAANVSREWARRVALYEPYHRSLVKENDCSSNALEENPVPAACLLQETIGELDGPDAQVYQLLFGDQEDYDDSQISFAHELRRLCKRYQQRQAIPTGFSKQVLVDDIPSIRACVAVHGSGGFDVKASKSAIEAATTQVQPPEGFSPAKATVRGAGRYEFTTAGPKNCAQRADDYLALVADEAKFQYARQAAANGHKDASPSSAFLSAGIATADPIQPTINIGLIGDVANGKSTLVHAMSGKRTQSHSTEQKKHGMTIRLGFANALVTQCSTCDLFQFHAECSEKQALELVCEECRGPVRTVKRVSFLDCPGHAELMTTMLTGASAFDAVILAAEVNHPCPSPQARQHLEALKASGANFSGRIAVAQTKSELLVKRAQMNPDGWNAENLLENHASFASEALQSTAAAGAPFFPVCAPQKLGMEPLARWIAGLPDTSRVSDSKSGHHILNSLRSFDINRPGKSIDSMVGGVVGGTVVGNGAFVAGEKLEVRPGLIVSSPSKSSDDAFRVVPFSCECTGMMTGHTPLKAAFAGGLVALQTSLNASLCADDSLLGSLVGPPNMLPPVWGPQLLFDDFEMIQLTVEKKLKLKKGQKVKCHSGSAAVQAVVVKVSKSQRKLELRLERPLCAYKGSKVAIEAYLEDAADFCCLAAHARLWGGTVCLEGSTLNPTAFTRGQESSQVDASSKLRYDKLSRQRFVQAVESQQSGDSGLRVSVPSANVVRDGGAHIVIQNFNTIAASLNRDPNHLEAYVEREGGLSCAVAAKGATLRVHWRRRGDFASYFRKVLHRYVVDHIVCLECKGAKTEVRKVASGSAELLCRQCNARRFVVA